MVVKNESTINNSKNHINTKSIEIMGLNFPDNPGMGTVFFTGDSFIAGMEPSGEVL